MTTNNSVNYSGNLTTDIANKQPLNNILTSLSGLGTLGILVQVASGAATARSIGSSDSSLTVSNGNAVLGNPDLVLNPTAIKSTPVTESTTARTLSVSDVNVTITCTAGGGDTTITIPTNASVAIPIGAQVKIINGAGGSLVTNIVAAGGVTLSPFTSIVLRNGGFAILEKIGANNWLIVKSSGQYTLTTNWTGIWASNQSGNITCSVVDGSVNLSVPQVLAVGNTNASFITAVTNLPTYLAPPFEIIQYIPVVSNGVNAQGAIVIESTGSITIYAGAPNFSNFTASGVSAGFKGFNVNYAI